LSAGTLWVPRTLSRLLTWPVGRVTWRVCWARASLARAVSVSVSLRFAWLAVLRVFGWLVLSVRPDRAEAAGILLLPHRVAAPWREVKTPRLSRADRAMPAWLAVIAVGGGW